MTVKLLMVSQTAGPLHPRRLADFRRRKADVLHMNDDVVLQDRMLKWFEYDHLPEHLQAVSQLFHSLAYSIVSGIEPWPERTVALRNLLDAKDAAVRAKLHPGG